MVNRIPPRDLPFIVGETIMARVGDKVLEAIGRNVWPVDCQSCGRGLGTELPSLVVSDMAVMAAANLHHPGCRPSRWDDQHLVLSTGHHLSFQTFACLIPLEAAGHQREVPFMFVNPTLEQVMLHRTGSEWEIATMSHYRDCGLTGLAMNNPAPDTSAALGTEGTVRVRLHRTGEGWEFGTTPEIRAAIGQSQGIALGVTTAYLPEMQFTSLPGFAEALQSGNLALGWIRLQ